MGKRKISRGISRSTYRSGMIQKKASEHDKKPYSKDYFIIFFFQKEQPTIQNLSAPKGEFVEPPKSLKPIIASSYELCPGFIAMVQEQTFLGLAMKTPTITYASLSSSMLA